jgi:hypothetical protein
MAGCQCAVGYYGNTLSEAWAVHLDSVCARFYNEDLRAVESKKQKFFDHQTLFRLVLSSACRAHQHYDGCLSGLQKTINLSAQQCLATRRNGTQAAPAPGHDNVTSGRSCPTRQPCHKSKSCLLAANPTGLLSKCPKLSNRADTAESTSRRSLLLGRLSNTDVLCLKSG